MFREWERWLKGADQHLPMTFESECAGRNKEAAFIMPLHPLVRQAAQYFEGEEPLCTAMAVCDANLPAGHYPFAVYAWEYCGLRNDLEICCVSRDPDLTAVLPDLLPKASLCDLSQSEIPDERVRNDLDAVHHRLWSDARQAHRQRTEAMSRARRESLATSHRARVALLREQLSTAINDKIRRMRQAQIDTAEADYAHRGDELAGAGEKADILARPVAFGMIHVSKGK